MMSEATFQSLLARGDVLVKDGEAYRPLAEGDIHRRMYLHLSDGTYTLLGFTASGVDGPAPVPSPQRVVIDIVGSLDDSVSQVVRAVKPVTEVVKGCVLVWLALMAVIVGGLMLLVLLFGDGGAPGLLQTSPVAVAVIVVVVVAVVVILATRRRRRT